MGRQAKRSGASLDFLVEQRLIDAGRRCIAGIDEAGRGPWAGPVVAAAVVLDPVCLPAGLDDSKKLSAARREHLYDEIMGTSAVGVAIGDVARIDRDNILNATLWAMSMAAAALPVAPDHALVDGNRLPALPCPADALVGGDGRSPSIAAASIIAKVARDRIMCELARTCPGYGWQRNKGYGTREHSTGLDRLGVTVHHRTSFAPVRACIMKAAAG